jgi:hypothetical protein
LISTPTVLTPSIPTRPVACTSEHARHPGSRATRE